ncbi:TPA: Lar family restriction alleviation protein [Yersinia enterocolitica]|nr:Lar family restriction alleviation protein [Yersinia enterocolitica]HDM8407714.1 Lar family restriction alleviation protein [Yersinia enterocolitica]
MNNIEELKPCPFCGGKAHLLTSNGSFLVECSVCLTDFLNGPVGVGWYRSEKDAAADWNDRPSERVLIAQLEAAQQELIKPLPIGELVQRLEGQTYEKWFSESDVKDLRERAEAAEAALSAANEKLSKPVMLPELVVVNISGKYPIEVMYASKVKTSIKAAGFTVEGDPAPVKYIVILQRAWCNDSGSGINYHSDLVEFDKRDKAIKHGFELQDSDDFNIGVLTNGVLTSFDWMAKPLAETKDSLARIASGIGIEGNADAE